MTELSRKEESYIKRFPVTICKNCKWKKHYPRRNGVWDDYCGHPEIELPGTDKVTGNKTFVVKLCSEVNDGNCEYYDAKDDANDFLVKPTTKRICGLLAAVFIIAVTVANYFR